MRVILPVKELVLAKQRLSGLLTLTERSQLFQAMLQDVLNVVTKHPKVCGVVLVSDDPFAWQLAADYNIESFSETALQTSGLNNVLQASVDRLALREDGPLMILHGDLPLICAADINAMWNAYRTLSGWPLVIAPDRHGTGTNALLFAARRAPDLGFGADSLNFYRRQAADYKFDVGEVTSMGLACDIDLPEDVRLLISSTGGAHALNSRIFLRNCGIVGRLQQAADNDVDSFRKTVMR